MCAWTVRPLLSNRDNIRTCRKSVRSRLICGLEKTNRETSWSRRVFCRILVIINPVKIMSSLWIDKSTSEISWQAMQERCERLFIVARTSRSRHRLCLVESLGAVYLPLSSSLSCPSKPRDYLYGAKSVNSRETFLHQHDLHNKVLFSKLVRSLEIFILGRNKLIVDRILDHISVGVAGVTVVFSERGLVHVWSFLEKRQAFLRHWLEIWPSL